MVLPFIREDRAVRLKPSVEDLQLNSRYLTTYGEEQ